MSKGLCRIDLRHRPFYYALLYPIGLPLWEKQPWPVPPKLRKKNGYWMTKAGGTETYFGKVADVAHADARRLFFDHLKAVADEGTADGPPSPWKSLCDLHLDWLKVSFTSL